ncbi:hypothetical protein T439DRAFT_108107 [Meredithblackwellia eburnea MCA 4105]
MKSSKDEGSDSLKPRRTRLQMRLNPHLFEERAEPTEAAKVNARAPFNTLPIETRDRIFELVGETPSGRTDEVSLKKASLVCRSWREPAQRTLSLDLMFTVSEIKKAKLWVKFSRVAFSQPLALHLHKIKTELAIQILERCRHLQKLRLSDIKLGSWGCLR